MKVLKYYLVLKRKQFHNIFFAKVNQQLIVFSALLFFKLCYMCAYLCACACVCVAGVCTCVHMSLEARNQHWVSSVTFHLQNDGLE